MVSKLAKIILPCILLAVGVYIAAVIRISEPVDLASLAWVTEPSKLANGDEIRVSVRTIGSEHVLIEVFNQSTDYVYLPYLPGKNGDRAEYAIRRIEQWDESAGTFISSGDGHYSPGLNPLAPGASYTYDAYVIGPGKYRVSMRILVDKPLRDRIINLHALGKNEYQSEMNAIDTDLDLASRNYTTPIFSF